MNLNLLRYSKITISLFFIAVTFSCVQSDYDLSKGLNTVMAVGGDSLALPIGETQKVLLSSVLKNFDMLKLSENGDYSIVRKDSLSVNVEALKPVTFTITPPTIPGVEMNFSDVVLPSFQINEISLSSPLPIPDVNVAQSILPIQYTKNYSYPIPDANPSQIFRRNMRSKASKNVSYVLRPIDVIESGSVEQQMTLNNYPLQLNKVNKIYLSSNLVHIVFNRKEISSLSLSSRAEKINEFRIDFPVEYKISSPTGDGARIDGSSFIIENVTLPSDKDEIEYTLQVDYLDLTNVLQNGALDFKRQIPYTLSYTFQGETNDLASLAGKSIDVDVMISSQPVISDLSVQTNTINVAEDRGTYTINKQITSIPKEILSISELNFKDGAYLQIVIDKPDIAPFTFTSGYCEIKLPSMFRFKRTANLNLSTNTYRVPYTQLFKTHKLQLAGATINKTFPETGGDISINDDITYKVSGFKLAPTIVNTSQVDAMTNKKYNFRFSSNLINIDNAVLVTREVTTKVPYQRTDLKVSKFVSDEVLKLYSASMAKPVKVTLNLQITGLPTSIDSIFFKNYTVKLPPFLKFVEGTTNYKNEIILNRGFKVSEGFTKIMELEKLDFGTDGILLDKGYLNIDDTISLSGSVFVKGVNIKSSDIGTVKVSPSVTVDDVTLGLIDGKFAPTIAPVTQNIMLNLPSYLMDDNVKLDVTDPVIMVEAGNAMGIPVDVDVTMTPKRKGIVLTDAIIKTTVSISAAEKLGEFTWSKFWLASSSEGVSAGYTPVVLPNLANLLTKIPDQIEMKMTPTVTSDHHKVDLTAQKNQLDVKYDVHIPMNFGAGFQIAYQDTVSGLNNRITKLVDYTQQLFLTAAVANQIPLELNMILTPLDANKKVIKGITISRPGKIKAGNADGSAQSTKLVIEMNETEKGALAQMDGLLISVGANRNSTIAGLPLREDQYFSIDLKILLPKGLTIDFFK